MTNQLQHLQWRTLALLRGSSGCFSSISDILEETARMHFKASPLTMEEVQGHA